MHKVGINFDEISDDPDIAIRIMQECGTPYGEIRTVNKKNFVFWTNAEVATFRKKVEATGIKLIAATTPLFKWYVNEDDEEIEHDSFGFNPRLSEAEKRATIERTFEIASALSIPRLRIFSGLGKIENPGVVFAQDELLALSLRLANQYAIDLYVENEPVCRVYRKKHIVELLNNQKNARLKSWLDVANLIELGEEVDKTFITQIASRLGYVHIKDFVMKNGKKCYIPVGGGQIDYTRILADITKAVAGDLIFTVETHADENKIEASVKSLLATKKMLSDLR